MRVVIVSRTGYATASGEEYPSGAVVDFADDLALKLLHHGIAEVAPKAGPETASVSAPEAAVKAAPKPRTKRA